MTSVVVDTDVVSLIFKRDSLSDKYLDAIDGKSVVLSFMTLTSSNYGRSVVPGERIDENSSANS